MRVCGQRASVSVVEKTTFGMSFKIAAAGKVDVGQKSAHASYVTRPMMCTPAWRIHSIAISSCSASSGAAGIANGPKRRQKSVFSSQM